VVTTEYPGAGIASLPETFLEPKARLVLRVDGGSAAETMRVLTEAASQIVAESLPETDPGSESFWRAWQQAFVSVRANLLGFSSRISVSFDTPFGQIALGSPPG
jgi:hypothetical protein